MRNRKFFLILLTVCVLAVVLTGCCLSHDWTEAGCEAPKTCTKCGETEGEALGHSWAEAVCKTPKTCERCGLTEGEAPGHSWVEASCEAPRHCTVCGVSVGQANSHEIDYSDPNFPVDFRYEGNEIKGSGFCKGCNQRMSVSYKDELSLWQGLTRTSTWYLYLVNLNGQYIEYDHLVEMYGKEAVKNSKFVYDFGRVSVNLLGGINLSGILSYNEGETYDEELQAFNSGIDVNGTAIKCFLSPGLISVYIRAGNNSIMASYIPADPSTGLTGHLSTVCPAGEGEGQVHKIGNSDPNYGSLLEYEGEKIRHIGICEACDRRAKVVYDTAGEAFEAIIVGERKLDSFVGMRPGEDGNIEAVMSYSGEGLAETFGEEKIADSCVTIQEDGTVSMSFFGVEFEGSIDFEEVGFSMEDGAFVILVKNEQGEEAMIYAGLGGMHVVYGYPIPEISADELVYRLTFK